MPRSTFVFRLKVRPATANCSWQVSMPVTCPVMYDSAFFCLHAVVILAVWFAVPLNQAHDIGERLEVLIETLPGTQGPGSTAMTSLSVFLFVFYGCRYRAVPCAP